MKIYFNGDSNTEGTELDNPITDGFAGILSNKFQADHINDGSTGASNVKISRTTEEYLKQCKAKNEYPDLIVIGWSDFDREEWFIDGEYRNCNAINLLVPTNFDQPRREHYHRWQGHWVNYIFQMSKFWNTQIHNFHLELTMLNIPHVFFNAFRSFTHYEIALAHNGDPKLDDNIYKLDWNNRFLKPYDSKFSMVNWAIEEGYPEITPGWFHFGKPAQEQWAEILYQHIKLHNII